MQRLLASAIKAKAPIAGISVEGGAPFCLSRKRLAAWAKGMRIQSVRVEQRVDDWLPQNLEAVKIAYPRCLVIEGRAGAVKTTATFAEIPRTQAPKTLREWAGRERERQQKKTLLGDLTLDAKRALKRAQFEDDGEGMIPVMVAGKLEADPKKEMMGVPVEIPEFPLLSFAVVKFSTAEATTYSITELISGQRCGSGDTPEEAIMDARQNARKLSPERIAEVQIAVWRKMEAA